MTTALPPLFSVLILVACRANPAAQVLETRQPPRVQHWGAMREVMREGKTEGRVELQRFAERGWYAIGALAGLDGEITVEDGAVLIARETPERLDADVHDARATLFTAAYVSTWRDLPLSPGADLAEIERAIAAALDVPLDAPTPPTPFQVVGSVQSLDLHVVRGSCPFASDAPEEQPARWSAQSGTPARLIGFFAPGRAGELTHHGTRLHAHALVDAPDGRRMGHLDDAAFAAGAILRVPAR